MLYTDWKTKEVTRKKINIGKPSPPFAVGDPVENLELKDLDRLIVHSIWEKVYKKNVAIEGDIQKPGTYQMADNMTVRDLGFDAGNVLESASLEGRGDFFPGHRREQSGRDRASADQPGPRALAGDPAHNVDLKPYDRLFIKRIPDWRPEKFVTVTGEIMFPGRYMIKKARDFLTH